MPRNILLSFPEFSHFSKFWVIVGAVIFTRRIFESLGRPHRAPRQIRSRTQNGKFAGQNHPPHPGTPPLAGRKTRVGACGNHGINHLKPFEKPKSKRWDTCPSCCALYGPLPWWWRNAGFRGSRKGQPRMLVLSMPLPRPTNRMRASR